MRVRLHSAARAEFLDAVARYEASVPGLGGRFLTEFARCVDLLCGTPTIGTPFGANLRRFVMDDRASTASGPEGAAMSKNEVSTRRRFFRHAGAALAVPLTATACFECTVEIETAIAGSYTLVDMLRVQGEGALRAVERRVLESSYVKRAGAWKIAYLVLRRA